MILCLLAVGCSSSGSPRAARTPFPTPRAQAMQLNLPHSGSSGGAQSGPQGGSGGHSVAAGSTTPGQQASPGSTASSDPAARPSNIFPSLVNMPGYQASLNVVNPGGSDSAGLARGFQLYRDNCAMCHGPDLKGLDNYSDMPVRDLTLFKQYKFGSSDQALYRTLVYGIPRTAMGNFQSVFSPAQIWDLINFLKSRRTD